MPKYQFYEKVRIVSDKPELAEVNGEVGAVLGMAEENREAFYAVFVYRDEECWDVAESDLAATGGFDKRESFYDGSSLRVSVDEHGEGGIANEERDA